MGNSLPTLPTFRGCIPGSAFNIASYALLTMMVAQVCGLDVGVSCTPWVMPIYTTTTRKSPHAITRTPYSLPRMNIIPSAKSIFDFDYKDFELINYQAQPPIKAEIAV